MIFSALLISVLLSLASFAIIVALTVHPLLRKGFPFYDPIADWVGHGLSDIGMIYMALVMMNTLPYFLPFSACAAFFALCAMVFLRRIATETSYVWWQDLLHAVGLGTTFILV